MKYKKRTKWLHKTMGAYLHHLIAGALIAGLIVSLVYKQPVHAASDRGKKAAGILVGAGVGGGIAGVAGSAKWLPLGFGVGGLAGGLLARHLIKRHKAKKRARQALAAQNGQVQTPSATNSMSRYRSQRKKYQYGEIK